MQDIDNELKILEVLASELEEYIVDAEVYRTVLISDDKLTMKMSGGDLLARLNSFEHLSPNLTRDQKDRLNTIITQVNTTIQELKTPFHNLLNRELKSRLGTLAWSREERRKNGDGHPSPAEEQNLVRIAAIRQELNEDRAPETNDQMDELEEELQAAIERLHKGQSPVN